MKPDSIYTINLDSRPERWALFQEGSSLWKEAFRGTPERVPAVAGVQLSGYDEKPWFIDRIKPRRKKSWGGKAGATLSHRNVIQMAFDQGLDSILIVEDDAFLTDEMVCKWKTGLSSLLADLPEDWAVINLCATTPVSPCRLICEYEGIRLIESCGTRGAVSYLLNGRILRDLLNELPDERSIWPWVARYKAIDRWFSRNLMRFGRVYMFAPAVVGHRVMASDITMTPPAEWTHDFEMKHIRLTKSAAWFVFKKRLRRICNICCVKISLLRLLGKRIRGL